MLGETLVTADFATFGMGELTIDPLSSTNIESCKFTGVDGTDIALTGVTRALSGVGSDVDSSRALYHPVGTLVIITFGVHSLKAQQDYFVSKSTVETITAVKNFTVSPNVPAPTNSLDVANKAYVQGVLAGSVGTASTTVFGTVKLTTSSATVVSTDDTRLPTQAENDAMAGTSGSPSSTNAYVTNLDTTTVVVASSVVRRLPSTGDIAVPATPGANGDATSKTYVDSDRWISSSTNATTAIPAGANWAMVQATDTSGGGNYSAQFVCVSAHNTPISATSWGPAVTTGITATWNVGGNLVITSISAGSISGVKIDFYK